MIEHAKTKNAKTTPCTVADDSEINGLRKDQSGLTRWAKQEQFARMDG
jgi:hypothetical protein